MSREPLVADAGSARPGLSQLLAVEAFRIGASAADWRAAVRLSGDALVASSSPTPGSTRPRSVAAARWLVER
jgi:hypothetical protein